MNAGRLFVKVIFVLITLVLLIGQVQAQDLNPTNSGELKCPHDKVCLDRAQAARYLVIEDENTALKAEIKVKDAALADAQKEIGDWRVKYAQLSGENTALKQNDLANRAIITAMIPMLRPKVVGLKIF